MARAAGSTWYPFTAPVAISLRTRTQLLLHHLLHDMRPSSSAPHPLCNAILPAIFRHIMSPPQPTFKAAPAESGPCHAFQLAVEPWLGTPPNHQLRVMPDSSPYPPNLALPLMSPATPATQSNTLAHVDAVAALSPVAMQGNSVDNGQVHNLLDLPLLCAAPRPGRVSKNASIGPSDHWSAIAVGCPPTAVGGLQLRPLLWNGVSPGAIAEAKYG